MVELIRIEKGKATALADLASLPAMQAKGWRRSPPLTVDEHGNSLIVVPGDGMFQVRKGKVVGWADQAIWPKLERAGWVKADAPVEGEATLDLEDLLAGLDPDNDDLWTRTGLLQLAAFNALFDLQVTRQEVMAAWPEFNRDVLREDQDEEL